MQFNSFLEDINDEEDYKQYAALLQLLGNSPENVERILSYRKQQFKTKNKKIEDAAVIKSRLEIDAAATDLEAIVFPDNNNLLDIPSYHRYVLHLLSLYQTQEVCDMIAMSRTSLWRWLKENNYPLKFSRCEDV